MKDLAFSIKVDSNEKTNTHLYYQSMQIHLFLQQNEVYLPIRKRMKWKTQKWIISMLAK